jgi:hypothetical protein
MRLYSTSMSIHIKTTHQTIANPYIAYPPVPTLQAAPTHSHPCSQVHTTASSKQLYTHPSSANLISPHHPSNVSHSAHTCTKKKRPPKGANRNTGFLHRMHSTASLLPANKLTASVLYVLYPWREGPLLSSALGSWSESCRADPLGGF